jgi:hypothetical protein
MSQDRSVTLRELTEELGLGELRGSYPLDGAGGALAVLGLRLVTALWVAGLIGIIATGAGAGAYGRLAIVGAVIVALYGARVGVRWLAGRYGGHRVLLYANGLVKTGWTACPTDWVQWAEVARVTSRRTMMGPAVLVIWTVEFRQADGGVSRLTVLGLKPRFLRALNQLITTTPSARRT